MESALGGFPFGANRGDKKDPPHVKRIFIFVIFQPAEFSSKLFHSIPHFEFSGEQIVSKMCLVRPISN
jgi:hypothetical protein